MPFDNLEIYAMISLNLKGIPYDPSFSFTIFGESRHHDHAWIYLDATRHFWTWTPSSVVWPIIGFLRHHGLWRLLYFVIDFQIYPF